MITQSPLFYLTTVSVEFHGNPQANILSEAVTVLKFLFLCCSGHDIETTTHFLLHSRYDTFARQSLTTEVNILDSNILEHN